MFLRDGSGGFIAEITVGFLVRFPVGFMCQGGIFVDHRGVDESPMVSFEVMVRFSLSARCGRSLFPFA